MKYAGFHVLCEKFHVLSPPSLQYSPTSWHHVIG
jgi:hypothetical protein